MAKRMRKTKDIPLMIKTGKIVARLREKSGITQDELAQAVGLSRISIFKIEHGQQRIMVEEILMFCAIFKVTPTQLLPPVPKVTMKKGLVEKKIVMAKTMTAKFKWSK